MENAANSAGSAHVLVQFLLLRLFYLHKTKHFALLPTTYSLSLSLHFLYRYSMVLFGAVFFRVIMFVLRQHAFLSNPAQMPS